MKRCTLPSVLCSVAILAFVIGAVNCAPAKTKAAVSPDDYWKLLAGGQEYMTRGDLKAARREFTLALEARPNTPRTMNLVGLTYFRERNNVEAGNWFRKAAEADPRYAPALVNLGGVQVVMGRLDEGRATLERALAMEPGSVAVNISLASVCFELGDLEKGSAYLKRALELDPEFPLRGGGLQTAMAMSGESLGEMYFVYAAFYAAAGRRDKMLEMLQKAEASGFRDWRRIAANRDFEKYLSDEELRKYLQE